MNRNQQGGTGTFILLVILLFGAALGGYLFWDTDSPNELSGLPTPGNEVTAGHNDNLQTDIIKGIEGAEPGKRKQDTENSLADHGTIMGQLMIEANSKSPAITEFTIWLEEARTANSRPKKSYPYSFPYFPDKGPAGSFRISPIPHFGAWRVLAMVPEMSTDEIIRVVDASHPVARVILKVEKGHNLTINVQDPERNAYSRVDVTLHPFGQIPGRRTIAAKTDGLGNAFFPNVVKGDWKIQVNQKFKRLAKPKPIQVTAQGPEMVRIIIPRGGKLEITLLSPGGTPLKNVKIQAYDLHSGRWEEYCQNTDAMGKADFGKVPPGKYQLRILNVKGFQRHHEPGVIVKMDELTEKTIYLKYKQ